MKLIPCHIFNSLAKPYLEALDDMIDEEEGELEEDDDKEEAGQENQKEQDNDDLYRKLIHLYHAMLKQKILHV